MQNFSLATRSRLLLKSWGYTPPNATTWSKQHYKIRTKRPLVDRFRVDRLQLKKEWWKERSIAPATFMGFPDITKADVRGSELYVEQMDAVTLAVILAKCNETGIHRADFWSKFSWRAQSLSPRMFAPELCYILREFAANPFWFDAKLFTTLTARIEGQLKYMSLSESCVALQAWVLSPGLRVQYSESLERVLRHIDVLVNCRTDISLKDAIEVAITLRKLGSNEFMVERILRGKPLGQLVERAFQSIDTLSHLETGIADSDSTSSNSSMTGPLWQAMYLNCLAGQFDWLDSHAALSAIDQSPLRAARDAEEGNRAHGNIAPTESLGESENFKLPSAELASECIYWLSVCCAATDARPLGVSISVHELQAALSYAIKAYTARIPALVSDVSCASALLDALTKSRGGMPKIFLSELETLVRGKDYARLSLDSQVSLVSRLLEAINCSAVASSDAAHLCAIAEEGLRKLVTSIGASNSSREASNLPLGSSEVSLGSDSRLLWASVSPVNLSRFIHASLPVQNRIHVASVLVEFAQRALIQLFERSRGHDRVSMVRSLLKSGNCSPLFLSVTIESVLPHLSVGDLLRAVNCLSEEKEFDELRKSAAAQVRKHVTSSGASGSSDSSKTDSQTQLSGSDLAALSMLSLDNFQALGAQILLDLLESTCSDTTAFTHITRNGSENLWTRLGELEGSGLVVSKHLHDTVRSAFDSLKYHEVPVLFEMDVNNNHSRHGWSVPTTY